MTMDFSRIGCDTSLQPARVAACVAAFMTFACSALKADAQAIEARRLVVLQSDEPNVDDGLKQHVDDVVLKTLGQRGFASAYVSPVPFADVELAAGCAGQETGCLQRIAATLDTDCLVVRELTRDEAKRTFLTLIAHDGSDVSVTRRAVAELSEDAQQTPEKMVPLLMDRLYPARAVRANDSAVHAAPRAQATPRKSAPHKAARKSASAAQVIGWSSAATGGALLAAGVVVGALSQRDQREYEQLEFRSKSDVDRGNELYARSSRRADIANGLFLGGAGAGTLGVAALLWDYLRPRQDERFSVRVAPARAGVAIALRTSWRGGL